MACRWRVRNSATDCSPSTWSGPSRSGRSDASKSERTLEPRRSYWSRTMTNNEHELATKLTPEAFAVLGGGQIAYVKPIRSEDVKTLFPQAPQLAPGMQFFALHAADGTPIVLTDSREAAIASAPEHHLDTAL